MGLITIEDTCDPLMDSANICTVHSNTISIFGEYLSEIGDEVLLQVINTLIGMEEKFAKDGFVRLTIKDDITKEIGEYSKPIYSQTRTLTPGVKTAIALATIALVACLAAILLYITVDRRVNGKEHPSIIITKPGKRNTGSLSVKTDRSDEAS